MGQRHRPEGELQVAGIQVEPPRAADHEAEVAPGLAPLVDELRELERIHLDAVRGQEDLVGVVRDPTGHLLLVAQLDRLDVRIAREHLPIVLDIVLVGRPEAADGDNQRAHGGCAILGAWKRAGRSAESTFTPRPRTWPGCTRISRTSVTRITSSR